MLCVAKSFHGSRQPHVYVRVHVHSMKNTHTYFKRWVHTFVYNIMWCKSWVTTCSLTYFTYISIYIYTKVPIIAGNHVPLKDHHWLLLASWLFHGKAERGWGYIVVTCQRLWTFSWHFFIYVLSIYVPISDPTQLVRHAKHPSGLVVDVCWASHASLECSCGGPCWPVPWLSIALESVYHVWLG